MITSWSPTRLADFEQCPAKARYKYLDKLPTPPAPALDRGTAIHSMAEDYVSGRREDVAPELEKVKKELVRLRKRYVALKAHVELELALTSSWTRTQWLAKDAWLRVKIDVLEKLPKKVAHVTDWKTGKVKESDTYDDQLNLYAVALLSTGEYERVKARLIFTDHGKVIERPSGDMVVGDLVFARKMWEDRANRMLTAKDFPPNPNYTCRWCPFSKAQGGPCKF